MNREAAAYWIARSSRAMTAVVCAPTVQIRLRQNNPTGKIPLPASGKSVVKIRPSHPIRGADRESSRTWGEMRWTRQRRRVRCVRRAVSHRERTRPRRRTASDGLEGRIRQTVMPTKELPSSGGLGGVAGIGLGVREAGRLTAGALVAFLGLGLSDGDALSGDAALDVAPSEGRC